MGQSTGTPVGSLAPYVAVATRVANPGPAGSFTMPVSALSFEPRVDVQSRNLAEGQADLAIRGGTFENTGIKVGALGIPDPQTGHYLAELPVPPAMLQPPDVLVGLDNAARGGGALAGTIAYGWREIRDGGQLNFSAGDHKFAQAALYQGWSRELPSDGGRMGFDYEVAHSESDGTRPAGDHRFDRIAGRWQWARERSQTDVFAGYQAKFFGWPNLYTPFGFNETDSLQTVLATANHRQRYGEGSWWEVGAFWRRNKDDYEFNRAVPGASNPFQHTTRVRGAAVEGRHQAGDIAVNYQAGWTGDQLQSTALTFGRYSDRAIVRAMVLPEWMVGPAARRLTIQAGGAYDDDNRQPGAWSPLASLAWTRQSTEGQWRTYVEYAGSSQVPSYTALNSNPAAGLFRGNPGLRRQTARNLEAGVRFDSGRWRVEAVIFRRLDDDLVDWTFRRGVTARTANPVDLRVDGLELLATWHAGPAEVVLGYSHLDKHADYRGATVDASFYALNFPRHRATAAFTWKLGSGWELRLDNEYRVQEPNPLRTLGGEHAFLTAAGLHFVPSWAPNFDWSLLVDNVWNSSFQEVPAVPAARRQLAVGAGYRW